MCSLSKEQSILSKETIQNAFFFFFFRIMSLFPLIFYQAPHSQALAPACSALISSLCPSICVRNTGNIVMPTPPSFAGILLKLFRYSIHAMKLCKMQFSIHLLPMVQGLSPVELGNFL